jgi:hypothetical protein
MIREPAYKTNETVALFNVYRDAVPKWLAMDAIPPGTWVKLPCGHIRICESIIKYHYNDTHDLYE